MTDEETRYPEGYWQLKESMDDIASGEAVSAEVSFAYIIRDPFTGEIMEDPSHTPTNPFTGEVIEGGISCEASEVEYVGQLLGVTATTFTVAIDCLRYYPEEQASDEEVTAAFTAGTLQDSVREEALSEPEIRTIPIDDVCDVMVFCTLPK